MTVIRDVLIYDGTGNAPFPGDVFFDHDRITAVGAPGEFTRTGHTVIGGRGLVITPGFIDVHAHSDLTLLAAPEAFSKISQGVTSEISGNCGLSFFPVTEKNRSRLRDLAAGYGVELAWDSFSSFVETLAHAVPAVNYNFLCGQNTLRAAVLGYEDLPATPDDITEMRRLLRESLAAGARGLSTGLLYVPGRFSAEEELQCVIRELAGSSGVYATHLRSEGDALEEALEEAVRLAGSCGVPLHISHLKTSGKRNWHKLDSVLRIIADAKARGVRITADRYPYTFAQTSFSVILPAPYDDMTDRAIQDVLSSDETEFRRVTDVMSQPGYRDWDLVILSVSSCEKYQPFCGKTLTEIGNTLGQHPAVIAAEILRDDAARAQGAFGGLSPENLRRILGEEYVCCGTDENARPADHSLGRSHPRGFGSFPRFLNEMKTFTTMSEAVRRVTSLPAAIFGLKDRGLLKKGYYADLVLLDEARLHDRADFVTPHAPAEGIHSVYVNGVRAYAPGEAVRRNGKLLTAI